MWEPGKRPRRPPPAPASDVVVVCVCGGVTKPRRAEQAVPQPRRRAGEGRVKGGFDRNGGASPRFGDSKAGEGETGTVPARTRLLNQVEQHRSEHLCLFLKGVY